MGSSARVVCAPIMQQYKILVIEDDLDIRDSLLEILDIEGYSVVPAANGREAIERLSELENNLPNLILLDLMMPVMDGFEFRREQLAHKTWSTIPVVVMSADANVKQKLEATGGPVPAYLKKPVNLDDVLGTVEQSLKH